MAHGKAITPDGNLSRLVLGAIINPELNEKLQLLSFSLQGKMNAKGYPVGLPGDMETASSGYNTCQQRLSLLLMAATLLLLVFTTMSKIFCSSCTTVIVPNYQSFSLAFRLDSPQTHFLDLGSVVLMTKGLFSRSLDQEFEE